MNKSLRKKYPEVKPYTWGYFIGWAGTLCWGTAAFLSFRASLETHGSRDDALAAWGVVFLFATIAHCLVILRTKWAWIVVIILQFNPILWLLNGIYLKNRWDEMNGLSTIKISNKLKEVCHKFNNISVSNRVLIAGSVFWALSVLAFNFMFEFGWYYIGWWQILKIIIFPPAIAVIGFWLYAKVIKQQDVTKSSRNQFTLGGLEADLKDLTLRVKRLEDVVYSFKMDDRSNHHEEQE